MEEQSSRRYVRASILGLLTILTVACTFEAPDEPDWLKGRCDATLYADECKAKYNGYVWGVADGCKTMTKPPGYPALHFKHCDKFGDYWCCTQK